MKDGTRALYFETSSTNPWQNLALEQVLSEGIGKGEVLLYLWQNDRTVVIGRNQNALRECRADLLEADGGCLARRNTGGGAVYHDLGNLCFTFAADPECYDLARQMKVVQHACAMLGVQTVCSGRNDIVTEDGRKFSGNAFSKTAHCQLQHGTLMVDVNREMLTRYLTPSPLKLQAKGIASVRSRVCNLKEISPDITIDSLKDALRSAFQAEYGAFETVLLDEAGEKRVQELCDSKYASWEWRYGKNPKFRLEMEQLFSWGEVQVQLEMKEMRITKCSIYSDCLDEELPREIEQALLSAERPDLRDAGTEAADERSGRIREVLEWLGQTLKIS